MLPVLETLIRLQMPRICLACWNRCVLLWVGESFSHFWVITYHVGVRVFKNHLSCSHRFAMAWIWWTPSNWRLCVRCTDDVSEHYVCIFRLQPSLSAHPHRNYDVWGASTTPGPNAPLGMTLMAGNGASDSHLLRRQFMWDVHTTKCKCYGRLASMDSCKVPCFKSN